MIFREEKYSEFYHRVSLVKTVEGSEEINTVALFESKMRRRNM